ncbi:hypothetical protein TNCV_544881 [Trichonephila clavipes]|nr:hypothetical protein TNCV_544881 [Trichonephila clavipes]
MGTVEATSVTHPTRRRPTSYHLSVYLTQRELSAHSHTDVEALFSPLAALPSSAEISTPTIFPGVVSEMTTEANIIKNLIDSTDTQIVAPTTPTRWPQPASIIDFALTRNIHWLSQVESIAELSSDHNPLIISFDTNRRFAFRGES